LKIKISYFKKWNKNGYVFNQGIRIDRNTYSKLNDCINAEICLKYPRSKEYCDTETNYIFLKSLHSSLEGKICFINHTQKKFINLFLKLKLLDRNTYLIINA